MIERRTRHVYNVTSFSPSAAEIAEIVKGSFHGAKIEFVPDLHRQAIVDTWAARVDDGAIRRDWGWQPEYDLDSAFKDCLIPTIRQRYVR